MPHPAFLSTPLPRRKPRPRASLSPQATLNTPSNATTKPADTFNWADQWYPVALTADLNRAKPNPITLLSTNLVAFLSHKTWVVLHDRCPHRHASLSHGRITGARLECAYHGWQFDPSGAPAHIPQSPRCPATPATPVRALESHGMLFCTLGTPAKPPPLVRPFHARYVVSAFSRSLPLCFTTVIQNLLDPAHIHFAHHGTIGHRSQAAPVDIRVIHPADIGGFMADYYSGRVRVRFRPPCLVEIVTSSGVSFAYYTTPLSRSSSKAFAIRSTGYRQFFVPPRWKDHLKRHRLLEDDLSLMQAQQQYMSRVNGQGYHKGWKEFCMPASADKLVVEMRRWLDRYAPEAEWYGCGDGVDHGRWGHTQECHACWAAWCRLGVVKRVLDMMSVAFLLVAAGCASPVLACLAGVCVVGGRAAQWMRRKFE